MHKIFQFTLLFVLAASCIRTPEPEIHYFQEIYYPEIKKSVQNLDTTLRDQYWVNVIDFGDRADFNAGHIPFAENIELDFFIDSNGYIVNAGRAITQRYDDRWEFIVYSSSNDSIAYWAAKAIERLGYSRVRFYVGGLRDWQQTHGDFLHMNETGFTSWYNAHFPFDDSLDVLVDVQPSAWFTGEEELAGHIPGAVNIPVASLVDTVNGVFSLVDGGSALSGVVPYTSARIVLYDTDKSRKMSEAFMAAASMMGYDSLYLYPNGYETWVDKGRELEQ